MQKLIQAARVDLLSCSGGYDFNNAGGDIGTAVAQVEAVLERLRGKKH
ncbi:MAG: hypothetical protein ABFR82_17830 [Nitrospirota bacterium]